MDKVEPNFMTERYRFLKSHLGIDLLSLDDEITQMPVLLQEVGEICSLAVEIRDTAKDEVAVAYAGAAQRARQNNDGLKPKSQDRVGDEAVLDSEYRRCIETLEDARLDASLWMGLSTSMQNKSYSLNLVKDLLLAGFITRDFALDKRRKELRKGAG